MNKSIVTYFTSNKEQNVVTLHGKQKRFAQGKFEAIGIFKQILPEIIDLK